MGWEVAGFLLINKAPGMRSHQVVEELRKITKIRKIGHGGTLDPLAQGLLILGIGKRATKKLARFLKMEKEYLATIKLGETSFTFDAEGEIKKRKVKKIPSEKEIKNALGEFQGKIWQTPPIFSAKKIKGKKLYQLARQRKKVKIKPVLVEIYQITLLSYCWPYLKIKVCCSRGTYLRSLAHDLGEKLGVGGYLKSLCRQKIGDFDLSQAHNLKEINSKNWQKFLLKINNEVSN